MGLLLLFLCNLGFVDGHFIRFCDSLFVRLCFPTLSEARQVTVGKLGLKAPSSYKARSVSYLFPSSWILRCAFCGKVFFKVFSSGQSDVRSGTSMTTCCVVNANMDSGDPGNQYCMKKHGSSYPQIVYWLRFSGVWNYPIDILFVIQAIVFYTP